MTFSDPIFAELKWTRNFRNTPLDLTGYRETWRDDFSLKSISGSDGTGTKWYAPARTDFGGAIFRAPDYVRSPFKFANGRGLIRMEKYNDVWQTGHMQTVNRSYQGFAQSMGYFEAAIQFPKGVGSWPSFWLIGQDASKPRVEIDCIEAYGDSDWDGHHSAIHLAQTYHIGKYTSLIQYYGDKTNVNMFDGRLHRYGVMVNDQFITNYYDGLEIARFPMTDYFRVPMYMNVTLAMRQEVVSKASGTMDLVIDYVRAMAKA